MNENPSATGFFILNTTSPLKVGMNRPLQYAAPLLPQHGINPVFLASGHPGRLIYSVVQEFKNLLNHHRPDFLLFNSTASFHPRYGMLGPLLYKIIAPQVKSIFFYWHESHWVLKAYQDQYPLYFSWLKAMSQNPKTKHLVVSQVVGQALQQFGFCQQWSEVFNCSVSQADPPPVSATQPTVINFASVQKRKGPDLFIEIAKQVHQHRPDVQFVWYGEGPDLGLYQQQIVQQRLSHFVTFPGYCHQPHNIMSLASALLLTSRDDPMPLSVVEALSHGKPVIAFNVGGASQILPQVGWLADSFNIQQAAAMVIEAIDQPQQESQIQQRQSLYHKLFSPESFARRFAQEIHRLT